MAAQGAPRPGKKGVPAHTMQETHKNRAFFFTSRDASLMIDID
jgi:hypothetical protein